MDNFDFDKLITQANGMLPASVYAEIAKIASKVTSDILKVGTAHGASAIATKAARGQVTAMLKIK